MARGKKRHRGFFKRMAVFNSFLAPHVLLELALHVLDHSIAGRAVNEFLKQRILLGEGS